MKRARTKKHSFLFGRKNEPQKPQNNYDVTDELPEENYEPEESVTDEPDDFAVPEEILEEAITAAEADVALPDDFAIPEESDSEAEPAVIESEMTAASELAEAESVNIEQASENPIDELPENEIPFSTEDYTAEEAYEEEEISVPIDESAQKREQKRMKWEKKRRRRRIITVSISTFLLFIVTGFALLGIDFSSGSGEDFLEPVDTATGKMNVLLLGVDADGERSDSIMLVNYDFDTHAIKLISIPRDTKMYVTDRAVTRKITEVHGMHDKNGKLYGAAAVAESVTALTGIPINYYLEFSFSALDNVMDILGPVTFDVPDIEGGGRGMNYDDDFQNLHIHLKPGVQELSGNQIQQFLRYRKSNYGVGDGSDTSRIGRQQELIKAIIDQKLNISFILKVPDIFKEMKSQIKTNFTLKDVLKYAGYLKDVSSDNMTTYVLPGESKLSGAWYHICDFDQTAELVSTEFGYDVTADELTNQISLTGKKASGKTNSAKNETDEKKTSSKTTNTKSSTAKKEQDNEDKDKDEDENKSNSSVKDSEKKSESSTKNEDKKTEASEKETSSDKKENTVTDKADSDNSEKADTDKSSDDTPQKDDNSSDNVTDSNTNSNAEDEIISLD